MTGTASVKLQIIRSVYKYLNYFTAVNPLVHRNLSSSFNISVIVWDIILFPVMFVFIAGYSFSFLFQHKGIIVGNEILAYPAYLASGIIATDTMFMCIITGALIWNDKINGMLDQILVLPVTRLHYVIASLITILVQGFISASIAVSISLPALFSYLHITPLGIGYVFFALITCSIFFGSVVIIASTKLRRREIFSITFTTITIFADSSSAFYPVYGAPQSLQWFFYINPMTFVADIIRAGLFDQITLFTGVEGIAILGLSIGAFYFAVKSLREISI